ncbi:MAG: hypothetical protein KDD62_09435 [Bdellovibrionales bacterium]|nr:hypothetical protein [Bdellovibrionales bacterium]
MHELGLSGGKINFLFDLLSYSVLALVIPFIAQFLFKEKEKAFLFALSLLVFPALFNTLNPLLFWVGQYLVFSEALAYLTMPLYSFLPYARTPEPQLSYVLIAILTYLALRLKSVLPLLLAIPFCYSFVSLPLSFLIIAIVLRQHCRVRSVYGVMFLSFLAVGLIGFVYCNFLMTEEAQAHLVSTRFPMISLTGILSVGVYGLIRHKLTSEMRVFSLLLAFSPLAASNVQVLSGFLAQPNNVEDFWGVLVIAFLTGLWLAQYPARCKMCLCLAVFLSSLMGLGLIN